LGVGTITPFTQTTPPFTSHLPDGAVLVAGDLDILQHITIRRIAIIAKKILILVLMMKFNSNL
jgi:hypothetical protein